MISYETSSFKQVYKKNFRGNENQNSLQDLI